MAGSPDYSVHRGKHLHEQQAPKHDPQIGQSIVQQRPLRAHPPQKDRRKHLTDDADWQHKGHDEKQALHHGVIGLFLFAGAHIARHNRHSPRRKPHHWADECQSERGAHGHGRYGHARNLSHPVGMYQRTGPKEPLLGGRWDRKTQYVPPNRSACEILPMCRHRHSLRRCPLIVLIKARAAKLQGGAQGAAWRLAWLFRHPPNPPGGRPGLVGEGRSLMI